MLAIRNSLSIAKTLSLLLQSDVQVWQEKKGWTGLYKLLITNKETYIVDMPYVPTNFCLTVIKPFY